MGMIVPQLSSYIVDYIYVKKDKTFEDASGYMKYFAHTNIAKELQY